MQRARGGQKLITLCEDYIGLYRPISASKNQQILLYMYLDFHVWNLKKNE